MQVSNSSDRGQGDSAEMASVQGKASRSSESFRKKWQATVGGRYEKGNTLILDLLVVLQFEQLCVLQLNVLHVQLLQRGASTHDEGSGSAHLLALH